MQRSDVSVVPAPYGLALEIEDLVLLRNWADRQRLELTVALDRTMDGAEFEELLILSRAGARRRTLTVWRTRDGIFAQGPSGQPNGYATVVDMLDRLAPQHQRRSAWRWRLGLSPSVGR